MTNINPTLIHGLALAWLEKKSTADNSIKLPYQWREQIDVRIYEPTGAGYYFITGHGPGKWYYKSDPEQNHYSNTTLEDVQAAIDAGGRMQICGKRGESYGVWTSWEDFAAEVLGEKSGNK